jgi:hypothetical protein
MIDEEFRQFECRCGILIKHGHGGIVKCPECGRNWKIKAFHKMSLTIEIDEISESGE